MKVSVLRSFLVTVLTGGWLLGWLAPAALADTCPTTTGYGIHSASQTSQYGSRVADNLVINPSTPCTIIRTVYIRGDSLNFVEIGYYDDGAATPTQCDHFTSPHVLVFALVNNFAKCKPAPPALTANQTYSFRVDNPDHDQDFVYYYDSDTTPDILLGFYATDIIKGYPQMADERWQTSDSLKADFAGVGTLGGGGNWNAYGDPQVFSVQPVNGWQFCSGSGTGMVVRAVGNCP